MSLGAFALIASEFMPVSLLSPIAADFRITEGQAGQAIGVSGLFAVVTSLALTSIAGKLDRKMLLLGLTGVMILSGGLVALAPNYSAFIVGRALIGIAIGGFWSMSAATVMRLVPERQVPRALAILNGGNAIATVAAAPIGTFLGALIGWRGAFFMVVPVAVVVLCWQLATLPSMEPRSSSRSVFPLLAQPVVALGMAAVGLMFMGQFALFTYLRPFLQGLSSDVSTISLIFLAMGVGGFVGTLVIEPVLKAGLDRTLVLIPAAMAMLAWVLTVPATGLTAASFSLALWGLIGTAAPVGWWTWLARELPDDAEAGGGLMVAVVQLSITLGAASGGWLFDRAGYQGAFALSAALLLLAAGLALATSFEARRRKH